MSEKKSGTFSVKELHAESESLLRDQHQMGFRNFFGDLLLEPRNPFQKSRRRPKRWFGVLIGVFLLSLLIAYYFHLR